MKRLSLALGLDLPSTRRHSGGAARLCHAVMTRALAGRGPAGATDWDDDRTVLVATVGARPVGASVSAGGSAHAVH